MDSASGSTADVTPEATNGIVASGVGRLLEGQRYFAEEMGLPYGRVFVGGFESFKATEPAAVVFDWLDRPTPDLLAVKAAFDEVVEHQLALVEAVGRVLASRHQPHKRRRRVVRRLSGVFSRLLARRTAPAAIRERDAIGEFAVAYAQARSIAIRRNQSAERQGGQLT